MSIPQHRALFGALGKPRSPAMVDRFRGWGIDNDVKQSAIEFTIWTRRNVAHDMSETQMQDMALRLSSLHATIYQKGYEVGREKAPVIMPTVCANCGQDIVPESDLWETEDCDETTYL